MVTKQELYDNLMRLQAENAILKDENAYFRTILYEFYAKTRIALGIEQAAEDREKINKG